METRKSMPLDGQCTQPSTSGSAHHDSICCKWSFWATIGFKLLFSRQKPCGGPQCNFSRPSAHPACIGVCYSILFSILPQWGKLCLENLIAGLLSIWRAISEVGREKQQSRACNIGEQSWGDSTGWKWSSDIVLARGTSAWPESHCSGSSLTRSGCGWAIATLRQLLGCTVALLWMLCPTAIEASDKADCCSSCSRDEEQASLTPRSTPKWWVGLRLSTL